MAENSFFRTGFRGFKKEDVLRYIDEEQRTSSERLNEAEQAYAQAQETVERQLGQYRELARRAEDAQVQAKDASNKVSGLEEKLNAMTALAKAYKQELEQTQAQQKTLAAERDTLRAALDASAAQNDRLQKELAVAQSNAVSKDEWQALCQQNERYAALIGDVGQFIAEVRALAQEYLNGVYAKTDDRLSGLDDTVTAYERQAADARTQLEALRQQLEQQRSDNSEQMSALADNLRQSADALSSDGNFFR